MDERRRKPRNQTPVSADISIAFERSDGELQTRKVRLVDASEWGLGFNTSSPMVVGVNLFVWGPSLSGAKDEASKKKVRVVHCRLTDENVYRTGCAFEDAPPFTSSGERTKADPSLSDLYEALQVSPSADSETIHRVYRYLAQRYHPDNPETGDSGAFQAVLQAFQVLSNPERRAAYDLQYQASRGLRWKIFEKPAAAEGLDAEKRMRAGILSALYTKRQRSPESEGMMLREIEELLGCPREHMEFALWYLRRKGFVVAGQNARFEITIEGVDAAEEYADRGLAPKGRLRAIEPPTETAAPEGESA